MERTRFPALFAIAVMVMAASLALVAPCSDAGVSEYTEGPIYGASVTIAPGNGPVYKMKLSYGDTAVFDLKKADGTLVSQVKYELNSSGELHRSVYNQNNYTRVCAQEKSRDSDITTGYFSWSYGPAAGSWKEAGGYSSGLSNPMTMYVWFSVESYETQLSINSEYTSKATVSAYMAKNYVKFNVNGGSGSFETIEEVTYTSSPISTASITMPSDVPTRDGYNFMGWSESKTDTSVIYDASATYDIPAGTSKTLYAIWQQDTVNVTLMDGDEVYMVIPVPRGEVPVLPSDLTKEDNTFVGWFTDAGFNNAWNTATAVTGPVTLYAGWKPDLQFTTDPVADCKVIELGEGVYMFDATVSKDYSTSAASVEWKVYKGDVLQYESTGPYMTCQFTDYGTYSVELKITNSNGVSSTYNEEIVLKEPSDGIDAKGIIAIAIVVILALIVIARMFL